MTTATASSFNLLMKVDINPTIIFNANTEATLGTQTIATFTATVTNPGSSPSYQWKLNGADISGATTTSYTKSAWANGSQLSFSVKRIEGCSVLSDPITLSVSPLFDQSTLNFVITNTVLTPGISNASTVYTLAANALQQSTTYYDGLGRPKQTVSTQGSPAMKDIVQPIVYDVFGREQLKYLPYADTAVGDGTFKTSAIADQPKFYKKIGFLPNDSTFARTVFEASPLNRLLQQGAPGAAWQPSAGHAVGMAYQTNSATEVKQWSINTSNQCVLATTNSGNYLAGSLYVTQTTDENGNRTKEYKDKEGRVVLKKIYNGTDSLQTYYVCDDFGLLRYVLPPLAVKTISGTTLQPGNSVIRQLCYYYHYDERHRIITKQLPGADSVLMVYDNRDRLVLSQDGGQRKNNQWLFTKYDVFNRPVMSGITKITDALTQAAVQAKVDFYYNNIYTADANRYETRADDVTVGYTLTNSFPNTVTEANLLTITFYDNYSFNGKQPLAPAIGISTNNAKVLGKVTGGKVRNLGTNAWMANTVYYDDKYRVIQSVKANHQAGTDCVTNLNDFSGKVTKSYTLHTGTSTVGTTRRFEYDHAGRLIKIWHQVDANPEVLMSYLKYNELGQLVDKKIHSTDAVSFLQSIDYRYNIRGWLTNINNADLGNATTNATRDNEGPTIEKPDAFGMEIHYNY